MIKYYVTIVKAKKAALAARQQPGIIPGGAISLAQPCPFGGSGDKGGGSYGAIPAGRARRSSGGHRTDHRP